MRILVTGANGFLGSRLVKSLREDGHLVYELTRSVADITDIYNVCKFIYDIRHVLLLIMRRASNLGCYMREKN